MKPTKALITPPVLSSPLELKTQIEHRRAYTFNHCELNLFETFEQGQQVPLQFHDLVVTSMLRGKKVMHLLDQPGFTYMPGETVIVPPSVKMEIDFPEASLEDPTQCTAWAIGKTQLQDTLQFLNERHPKHLASGEWKFQFQHIHFDNSAEIAQLVQRMVHISLSNSLHKDVLSDLATKELLIRIMQMQNVLHDGQAGADPAGRLGFLRQYIRAHLTEPLTVAQLSAQAHMSVPHFYRAFKTEFGLSPMDFVIRERIQKAKELLSQQFSVKEACYGTGFNNMTYFIRIFRKYEGVTPGTYYKMMLPAYA